MAGFKPLRLLSGVVRYVYSVVGWEHESPLVFKNHAASLKRLPHSKVLLL